MRLERITNNKIKIFITSDDLTERGLSKEDIWHDSLKWRQLFHDMLEEANKEFNVDLDGSIAVEIFSIQAQGMIMIVTVDENDDDNDLFILDGLFDMQVVVEENNDILFEFENIEDIIQLANRLSLLNITGGSLYSIDTRFFIHFENNDPRHIEKIVPLLAEYGNPSVMTVYRLQEYGKAIIKNHAIETLAYYFK